MLFECFFCFVFIKILFLLLGLHNLRTEKGESSFFMQCIIIHLSNWDLLLFRLHPQSGVVDITPATLGAALPLRAHSSSPLRWTPALQVFAYYINMLYCIKHFGPHLSNKCMIENWAYGQLNAKLGFINMDMFGSYDQISRLVWAHARKFSS